MDESRRVALAALCGVALSSATLGEAAESGTAGGASAGATATFVDYSALRAYTGSAKVGFISGVPGDIAKSRISGNVFRDDGDQASVDDGGCIFIDGRGRRWKRLFLGAIFPEWFGADPTGKSVSTSAIESAAQAASALGGGRVEFGPGVFLCQLTLFSKVHYVGQGIEATVLKLPDGANADLIRSEGVAKFSGSNSRGGVYSWSLSHLTLDGNKSKNPSGGAGVKVYGYSYQLENLAIRNCRGVGIVSEWSSSPNAPAVSTEANWWEARLINVSVHENDGGGIDWRGPHDSMWVNVLSYFNSADRNIYIGPSTGGGGPVYAVNCHAYGSKSKFQWYCEQRVSLSGCVGEGATEAQIYLGQGNSSIHGGEWFSVVSQTPEAKGIILKDGLAGLDIITSIYNCNGGAIYLGAERGPVSSRINIIAYQAKGPIVLGVIPTDGEFSVSGSGGAGGNLHRMAGSVSIAGNLGLGAYGFGGGSNVLAFSEGVGPKMQPWEGGAVWLEKGVLTFRNSNYKRSIVPGVGEKQIGGLVGQLTVDVTNVDWIRLECVAATVIKDLSGAASGQQITLLFADNLATLQNGKSIALAGKANFRGTEGSTITLRWSMASGKWFEVCRSMN